MIEAVIGAIVSLIELIGYPGLAFLMALESTVMPVPSEIVMPFAGYMIARGNFSFFWAITASTIGSVIGSAISYYIGAYGGNRLVSKIGKYLLLNESHLLWTENWFKRHGEKTILISRFVPVVRHFISIPAGIGRMNKPRFLFYTLVGSLTWNSFLLYAGFYLGASWERIHVYSQKIDIALGILLVMVLAYYAYQHFAKN